MKETLLRKVIKGKNALIRCFIFIFVFQSLYNEVYSQTNKYLLLSDCKDSTYSMKTYKLNTKDLYKSYFAVCTYNIIFPAKEGRDELIVLFSLLPDFKTQISWVAVTDTDILNELLDLETLEHMFSEPIGYSNYDIRRKFFNEYILFKEINGKYYTSKNCLMEVFSVKKSPTVFPSFYGQLKLSEDVLPLKELSKLYDKSYPQYSGSLPISYNATLRLRGKKSKSNPQSCRLDLRQLLLASEVMDTRELC